MTDELTVAKIAAREGLVWPPNDPDAPPRHLIDETDPQPEPGELTAFWFGAPPPRRESSAYRDAVASLARLYVQPIEKAQ